jgi:two-component system LytT family response regulator
MENLRAIIIDDEHLAREVLKKYLSGYDNIELAAECSNGFEGIKEINEQKPDIIFLDVQMPKINGFEMLELLDDPPVIIFTTAFDQYALKAFEANAVDYLLKPFSKERFDEAIERAYLFVNKRPENKEAVSRLSEHIDKETESLERVIIKDGSKISIVPAENIKWIEAQDDYVMIHTAEGKFLKQKTMKYFEAHLSPDNFVRIHRSYIVSVNEIKNIELLEKESYQIHLKDGDKLPVSKTGYSKLKEILNG